MKFQSPLQSKVYRNIFVASGIVVLALVAYGQQDGQDQKVEAPPVANSTKVSDRVIKSEFTYAKISQLNIAKLVLPLLLDKKQINALLLSIEKCRRQEMTIREKDADELLKLDGEITKSLKEALEEGKLPSRELQQKIIKVQDALLIRRQIATNELVDEIYGACKATLNAGQLKAMANGLDPASVDPSLKGSTLTEEQKIKNYIRFVMLDAMTYEILKALAKSAS